MVCFSGHDWLFILSKKKEVNLEDTSIRLPVDKSKQVALQNPYENKLKQPLEKPIQS